MVSSGWGRSDPWIPHPWGVQGTLDVALGWVRRWGPVTTWTQWPRRAFPTSGIPEFRDLGVGMEVVPACLGPLWCLQILHLLLSFVAPFLPRCFLHQNRKQPQWFPFQDFIGFSTQGCQFSSSLQYLGIYPLLKPYLLWPPRVFCWRKSLKKQI